MSVWLTIPSARPAAEIKERLDKWRGQGYKIALWRNGPHAYDPIETDWVVNTSDYAGWGKSINAIIKSVVSEDPSAEWFVGGGDDTDPDMSKTADQIARECTRHFGVIADVGGTVGVMQPTGDRWGENEPWARAQFPDAPAYIDRICGSPWIGREFARRMNGGKGPFWPSCFHMFSDQILKEVAEKMGVLWQRRDLIHFHDHCRRDGVPRTPDFAGQIYGPQEWEVSKREYERLKALDFSECVPIP